MRSGILKGASIPHLWLHSNSRGLAQFFGRFDEPGCQTATSVYSTDKFVDFMQHQ
jgi:hypothetical protein